MNLLTVRQTDKRQLKRNVLGAGKNGNWERVRMGQCGGKWKEGKRRKKIKVYCEGSSYST